MCTCLCAQNIWVKNINLDTLQTSAKPVINVPSHDNKGAKGASEKDAEGMPQRIYLMVGARVMLTRNLWTAQGLTNSTLGTVHSIDYS